MAAFQRAITASMSSEIVCVAPAFVFPVAETIQRIEADPVAEFVRVIHQGAQAAVVLRRPVAGLVLAAFLDGVPRIVPPAAIVGGRGGQQLLRRQRGQQPVVLFLRLGGDVFGVRGPEDAQFGTHRHLLEKDVFLGVGVLGQDQQRLGLEGGQLVRVGGLRGGSDPTLVLAEQVPDRVQQLGLDALEIEVEHDDGPARAIVIGQRFFDDGAHAFEEVIAQRGFAAGGLGGVRDHRPALAGGGVDGPGEILLDTDGEAGLERAIDAVLKIALVRIAVVRVQYGAVVIEEIEIGLAKQGQRTAGREAECALDSRITQTHSTP